MSILRSIVDIIVDYIIPIILFLIAIAGSIISMHIRRRRKYESYFKNTLEKGGNRNTFEKMEEFSKYSAEMRRRLAAIDVNSTADNLPYRILCRAAVQFSL